MKIVSLMEDTPGGNGCLFEHGFSLYVETKAIEFWRIQERPADFSRMPSVLGLTLPRWIRLF